ncbi:MAG: hypothetical protein WAQ08_18010 [Aquabacterium sp.]|jgi:hypothetical protein|uniref:hypothetical protein n=1 Tax=Aquabacterium sp. TaxID=1872578 RepID=UPI003BB02964
MAQVLMSLPAGRKWIVALGAVAVAAMAAAWWTHSSPPETTWQEKPDTAAGQAASTQAVAAQPQGLQLTEVMAGQSEAAKALATQPAVKPIDGPVTERPAFVSPMEWMVLKGTVSQHPHPERELTRMVNFLRFTKQMELLETLPRTADVQPRRQALANELLADLPQRLLNDEMPMKDLRETQAMLLQDAEPDPERRQARAQIEARRLEQALSTQQAKGPRP